MRRRCSEESGFAYVEALFVTMILSMAAMLVMRGFQTIYSSVEETAVRTTALHLANAQLAELRYLASTGNLTSATYGYLGARSDLKVENVLGGSELGATDAGLTVAFEVTSIVVGSSTTVEVTPTVNGRRRTDWAVTVTRTIINVISSEPEENSTDSG